MAGQGLTCAFCFCFTNSFAGWNPPLQMEALGLRCSLRAHGLGDIWKQGVQETV